MLRRHLAAWPAEFVTGPRAVGKTTTALRHAASTLRLDQTSDRGLVLDDPDVALREGPFPLLIDEWQHAPEVLGAVKRAVDTQIPTGGQFILTGSSRNDLHSGQWPLVGRSLATHMWPLTGRERFGNAAADSLFDRWDSSARFTVPPAPPDLLDYLDIALDGGFPGALVAAAAGARNDWMRTYVDTTVVRDLPELAAAHGRRRHPDALRRYLGACALHTAGVVPDTALAHAAGMDRRTAVGYHGTLNVLRLVADVPAWHSNQLKRLTSMPKRLLADSGLAAWLIGTDNDAIRRDPAVRGRIVETFVAAQLRVEIEAAQRRTTMFHLRTQGGEHEVDLVVEFGTRLAAFEVKTSSGPSASDARHLAWLRDNLPVEQFAGGVVFHTGARRYGLGDRIEAVPIAGLWG
ncbi:ATP-binding protein [Candidatus Poriferisodalis sp.]|uniref:ATP-binding protein n=1 Tax=Candidatus Poriferisodalis sp. TaxID=3101277 RepID=UPI003C6FAD7B